MIICFYLLISFNVLADEMKAVGGIFHHRYDYEDLRDVEYKQKYMFPCLDQQKNPQQVMMLCIYKAPNTYRRSVHVYKMSDLLEGFFKNIKPSFQYPKQVSTGSFNPSFDNASTDTPFCFQQGLFYLIKQTNREWAIYKVSHNNHSTKQYSGKAFPWFFQKADDSMAYCMGHEVVLFEPSFFSKKNVYQKDKDIISFDIPDKNHQVISFYNEHHNPDIEIKLNGKTTLIDTRIDSTSISKQLSELYPKFSNSKKYFAYFRNRLKDPDAWDIVVQPIQLNKPPHIIPNVRMYDINETAFFFHDSFQWLNDRLYFMNHRSPNTIFEFNPENNSFKPYSLSGNILSIVNPSINPNTKKDYPNLTFNSEIISSDWFQVAENDQKELLLIVECRVKTKCPSYTPDQTSANPVRRIVIFKKVD